MAFEEKLPQLHWVKENVKAPGPVVSKSNGFLPGPEERLTPKMKLFGSILFQDILNTDTHTAHRHTK